MKEKVSFGKCVVAQFGNVYLRLYVHKYNNRHIHILEYISNIVTEKKANSKRQYLRFHGNCTLMYYVHFFRQMYHTIASTILESKA